MSTNPGATIWSVQSMISASYPSAGRSRTGSTASIRSSATRTSPRKGSPPDPSATRPPSSTVRPLRGTVRESEDMSDSSPRGGEHALARHLAEDLAGLRERPVDLDLGVGEGDVVALERHRVHERALLDHAAVEAGVGLVVVAEQVAVAADFALEEVGDEHGAEAGDVRGDAELVGDRLEPGAHAVAQAVHVTVEVELGILQTGDRGDGERRGGVGG